MEEETHIQRSKWEGKTLLSYKAPQQMKFGLSWQIFANFHKCFPILDTCYQVEGVPGQPGVIRYASLYPDAFGKTSLSAEDHDHHDDQRSIKWVTEKLLAIDPIERCLRYEIVDNNMGFNLYV